MNRQPASTFSAGQRSSFRAPTLSASHHEVFEANIVGCRGCGYCNIGCQFGAKLSMLDKVLPEAQEKFDGDTTAARCASFPIAKRSES